MRPPERRHWARRTPDAAEPLSRVRLRTGRELAVVDIAAGGALVEGEWRLLPGTHVDVHVITADGRILVRSRILRAWVHGVWSDRLVYRSAIAFERLVNVADGYRVPGPSAPSATSVGTSYPAEAA